jgi:NitT/TauT family transport system ATP-binding protein
MEIGMIEFENVGKSFNGHTVLKDTSFCINGGEVAGLLGRSGSGKSTILKLISGIMAPDRGRVHVGSTRVGYIFQEPRLIPWKRVLDNVSFGLRASGHSVQESRARAMGYLERVGLSGVEHHYPGQLSGGMCQRVSIARAFAIKPDILLMDEPFSALDEALKEQLLNMTRDMLTHQDTMTVLYVSHNPEEVRWIADKTFMLNSGGVIRELPMNGDMLCSRLNADGHGRWKDLYEAAPNARFCIASSSKAVA